MDRDGISSPLIKAVIRIVYEAKLDPSSTLGISTMEIISAIIVVLAIIYLLGMAMFK